MKRRREIIHVKIALYRFDINLVKGIRLVCCSLFNGRIDYAWRIDLAKEMNVRMIIFYWIYIIVSTKNAIHHDLCFLSKFGETFARYRP